MYCWQYLSNYIFLSWYMRLACVCVSVLSVMKQKKENRKVSSRRTDRISENPQKKNESNKNQPQRDFEFSKFRKQLQPVRRRSSLPVSFSALISFLPKARHSSNNEILCALSPLWSHCGFGRSRSNQRNAAKNARPREHGRSRVHPEIPEESTACPPGLVGKK